MSPRPRPSGGSGPLTCPGSPPNSGPEVIAAAAETGGHFGGGLGVVELTVALHYVFDTPRDRLIWDVSHQAYPHKILTGRRARHPLDPPEGRALRLHQAQREPL